MNRTADSWLEALHPVVLGLLHPVLMGSECEEVHIEEDFELTRVPLYLCNHDHSAKKLNTRRSLI